MESLNMTIQEAARTAQDRATWRMIIKELPLRRCLPLKHRQGNKSVK